MKSISYKRRVAKYVASGTCVACGPTSPLFGFKLVNFKISLQKPPIVIQSLPKVMAPDDATSFVILVNPLRSQCETLDSLQALKAVLLSKKRRAVTPGELFVSTSANEVERPNLFVQLQAATPGPFITATGSLNRVRKLPWNVLVVPGACESYGQVILGLTCAMDSVNGLGLPRAYASSPIGTLAVVDRRRKLTIEQDALLGASGMADAGSTSGELEGDHDSRF